MPKEYKIETMQDLFNVVTPENVYVLENDVSQWLRICASLKASKLPDTIVLSAGSFTWIDDGQYGCVGGTLTLNV
jgi:hypothetical protein